MDLFADKTGDSKNEEEDVSNKLQLSEILENIYTEMWGKELVLSFDQRCGKILERILKNSTEDQLSSFVENTRKTPDAVKLMIQHGRGSYVLQSLIRSINNLLKKDPTSEKLQKTLLDICEV